MHNGDANATMTDVARESKPTQTEPRQRPSDENTRSQESTTWERATPSENRATTLAINTIVDNNFGQNSDRTDSNFPTLVHVNCGTVVSQRTPNMLATSNKFAMTKAWEGCAGIALHHLVLLWAIQNPMARGGEGVCSVPQCHGPCLGNLLSCLGTSALRLPRTPITSA